MAADPSIRALPYFNTESNHRDATIEYRSLNEAEARTKAILEQAQQIAATACYLENLLIAFSGFYARESRLPIFEFCFLAFDVVQGQTIGCDWPEEYEQRRAIAMDILLASSRTSTHDDE